MEMNQDELRIIEECLEAAAQGPFFPDREFQTLFGLNRDEVVKVANWPPTDEISEEVHVAVSGALNLLTGYPHGKDDEWTDYISVSPQQVRTLLHRWEAWTARLEQE